MRVETIEISTDTLEEFAKDIEYWRSHGGFKWHGSMVHVNGKYETVVVNEVLLDWPE